MNLSMYEASVPPLKRMLNNLSRILEIGANYANNKKFDPLILVTARLYPDMFPLTKQIQIATDQAKACAARLAGVEVPTFEHIETTFEELQARIARTLTFIDTIPAEQINGSEDRDIVFQVHGTRMEFKGRDFLFDWIFPNFYFHVITAYNILRHNGVEIGKNDYLGRQVPVRNSGT